MWQCKKNDDQSSSSKSTNSSCEKAGNHLYFYSEISRGEILKLNKELAETAREMKILQIEKGLAEPPEIFLHINSYGGSIFAGIAAMDAILKSDVPITTIVEGCAASAATFLSLVGGTRKIDANAYMLIHQLSSGVWGKYADIIDHKENMDALMKKIKEIYKKFTNVPTKELDKILSRDLWWDAKKCLKYGLVDEII